jgi:hypothetical protein
VVFPAHAAFAKPEIYEALEERGVKYAIRIAANDGLEKDIAELLTRPVERRAKSRWSGTRVFSARRPAGITGCYWPRAIRPVGSSGRW